MTLSPTQRAGLNRILTRRQVAVKAKAATNGKIVENIDPDTRVMWQRDENGDAVVLAIVSMEGVGETPAF